MNRQLAQKFAQAPFKGVEFDPFMKIYRNVTDFRYINKFLTRSQITLNPLNSRGLKWGLGDCNTKE